jgi:hypothetical protein
VLVLEPADASNPGVVNTGTQSFAGSKTFDTLTTTGGFPSTSTTTGDLIVAGGAGIGGAVNVAATVSATGLALPDTNAAGSAGVIMFGGQRFVSDYGTNNTFIGANSGNTTLVVGSAFANTAVGRFALGALTSGSGNVGVGFAAGINLMNGSTNVGVGDGALLSAIGAGGNVAIGANALSTTSADTRNIAIGVSALAALDGGSFNTCVGDQVLQNLTAGSTNIVIGSSAGSAYTAAESTNILIGNAGVGGDNAVTRIGNAQSAAYIAGVVTASTGVVATTGNITATAGNLVTLNGNLVLTTPGNKILIAAGGGGAASVGVSNAMALGTTTVLTSAVTANSIIFLTTNTPGGMVGTLSAPSGSITPGVSFVINSASALDTSTVNWIIIN